MKAFATHFALAFREGVRNRQSLLMTYLLPLGFYLMMGAIMPAVNPPFRENMVPAMVIFAVMAATLLGLPDPLVNAREAGIFRNYRINGVPALSILVIPALTTVLHTAVVAAIITASAPPFFGAVPPANWPGFVLTFLAMALACAGIALLIGVVSPSSRVTVLWSQLVFLPSMLIGGMMMPYHVLPKAAGKVAQLLPATHAMNAFRGLGQGLAPDFAPWVSIGVLLAGGLAALALAVFLFNWDRHNRTQRGHPLLALLALVPYLLALALLS